MTPCEKLGYKVGDTFTVTCGSGEYKTTPYTIKLSSGFTAGQVITLSRDDGSDIPLFSGENERYCNGPKDTPGAYLSLAYVTPYIEGE